MFVTENIFFRFTTEFDSMITNTAVWTSNIAKMEHESGFFELLETKVMQNSGGGTS